MLFDETGKIRVRRTGKYAQQTLVAEQENGRILLFKTTQAAALHDLGACLRTVFPGLRRAMAMDGGSSSDLALAPALQHAMTKAGRTPAGCRLTTRSGQWIAGGDPPGLTRERKLEV